MNSLKTFATLIVFAFSTRAVPVRAALLTGTITGSVTSAGSSVPGVTVGSAVSGSYTYNTSTPFTGLLGTTDPLTALSLSIGANTYVFSMTDVAFALPTRAGVVPGRSTSTANELFLFFTNTAIQNFDGGAIGTQTVSNSPSETFVFSSDGAHSFSFNFAALPPITVPNAYSTSAALPPTTVSEPGSVALLFAGAGVAIALSRRRLSRAA